MKDSRKRLIISIFIVLNVLTMVFVQIKPRAKQTLIGQILFPYAFWTRNLQEWSLFSPNPRKAITSYKAEIWFQDGSHIVWQRPYPDNWSFFQRHTAYNWQKFDLAGHNLDNHILYDDLADWLKRQYANPKNPPINIKLFRTETPLPPPNPKGDAWADIKNLTDHDLLLFDYSVNENRFVYLW